MEPLLEVSRLAVNCEYVSADSELHDGDEVVVIPPVSGG
jgi:molybdopterin synthase sulfur carrier subunit